MEQVMISENGDHTPNGALSHTGFIHVEVCQTSCSTVNVQTIKQHVAELLNKYKHICNEIKWLEFDDPLLSENVRSISISNTDFHQTLNKMINVQNVRLDIHVYQLYMDGPVKEDIEDEDMPAADHWLLPSVEFDGLWESLVFDEDIKGRLLQYAMTTLLFADRKVDTNIISWNKVVLLHGPPGTGKTSLCKALAQKLCIHMSNHYEVGQLIEINSHSLFSKWFSESGKLVMKMFQKIQELIDDPRSLVCVLIDEIESLTAARRSVLSSSEPSDAIRVVNALLTQLDNIKRFPNVIILTTSNITGAIDLAFVDRADIKQYIGPPSAGAIFQIYYSCIVELMRTGIISPPQQLIHLRALEAMRFAENAATRQSLHLRSIASKSYSLSGRTLRKIPFIAHANHLHAENVTLDEFLDALSNAVDQQFRERQDLTTEGG